VLVWAQSILAGGFRGFIQHLWVNFGLSGNMSELFVPRPSSRTYPSLCLIHAKYS